MKRLELIAAGLASALAGGCASSEPAPPPSAGVALTPELAALARSIGERAVAEDGVVGLSIGVALDGEVVFAEGFGHADAARTVPATRDTIYDVASVGKQFTAAAVLRLAEQGRLSLENRIRALVPEVPAHFPDATIEQLLSHTSGFVSGDLDEQAPPADYATKRYGLELLTDVELQTGRALFEPGETWVYSNAGYLVLGLVVESASGRRYDEYVREELLRRNDLGEMTVCERAEGPRMSESIRRTESGIAPVAFIDMTAYSGQGSICSSVVDLLRWSAALDAGRVVSGDSLRTMRSPSTVRGASSTARVPYGFAQRLGALGPHARAGHTGTFDGGSAALYTYPDAGLTIAVLSNTRGAGTPHAWQVELELAKALLGFEEPPVEARPPTAAERDRIAGTYSDGRVFRAVFDGEELVVSRDGEEQERLFHVGDLRFRRADQPDVQQWFLPDGEHAGWWVYSLRGSYVEVLRRVAE